MRSGTCRRLKIDPANSTSGSRTCADASRLVAGQLRDSGIHASHAMGAADRSIENLVSRRFGDGEDDLRARGRPFRHQPASQPFAHTEPFRMRRERQIVNQHDARHRQAQAARCSRARRRRRAVAAFAARARSRLFPPGAAGARHPVQEALAGCSGMWKDCGALASGRRARRCGAPRAGCPAMRRAGLPDGALRRLACRRARGHQCRCA